MFVVGYEISVTHVTFAAATYDSVTLPAQIRNAASIIAAGCTSRDTAGVVSGLCLLVQLSAML
jgi:hypothetical protein